MAGVATKTRQMDDASITVKEQIARIQIGRHFLDGADADWVQKRFQLSLSETKTAWSSVVAMLEHALEAPASTVRFFELPDALALQTEGCLRLLLDWHDQLRQMQLVTETAERQSLNAGDDVASNDGSAESGPPC